LARTLVRLATQIETLDTSVQDARPHEAVLRESDEAYASKRIEVTKILDLFQRRGKLVGRRVEIGAA
jgi:hypothetical protein